MISYYYFFRAVVIFFVLFHLSCSLIDFEIIFGLKSIVPLDFSNLYVNKYIASTFRISESAQISLTTLNTVCIFLVFIFGVLILLNTYFRLFSILLLAMKVALYSNNVFALYGVDYYETILLFFICIMPSDLNSELNISLQQKWLSFFRWFVAISYFFSGFTKAIGINWWNGEAIWKAINLPYWNNSFSFEILAAHPWICITLGIFTVLIELFHFFSFFTKFRIIIIFLTILIHIGILVFLGLYSFSLIMIFINILLLLSYENYFYSFIRFFESNSSWTKA